MNAILYEYPPQKKNKTHTQRKQTNKNSKMASYNVLFSCVGKLYSEF